MRQFLLTLSFVATLFLSVAAGAGGEEYVQTCLRGSSSPSAGSCSFPPLQFKLGVRVAPQKLQRRELTPAALSLFAKVATTDGTQPSALREIEVDLDKDWAVDADGLPSCGRRALSVGSEAAARRACAGAIVGNGIAHVQRSGSVDSVPLTLFNGGTRSGTTTVLVYGSMRTQSPAAIVVPVEVEPHAGSGLHAVAKIPSIAGGAGSILDFSFEIRRSFMRQGEQQSYLSARCPDGAFELKTRAIFRNELHTAGIAPTTTLQGLMTLPCIPTG